LKEIFELLSHKSPASYQTKAVLQILAPSLKTIWSQAICFALTDLFTKFLTYKMEALVFVSPFFSSHLSIHQ
jgi:hypothetical protein